MHLVYVLAGAGAQGGVAEESDLRVNAEDLRAVDGLSCDLDQLVLVGLDVDSAVSHGKDHVVAGSSRTDQDEAGRHDLVAGLGLDDLQSRTDCVSGGIGSTAQEAVSLAHLDQHGAEIVSFGKDGACLFGGHAFGLSDLTEHVHHLVHLVIVFGIDNDRAADVEALDLSCFLDLIHLSEKDGGQEVAGQKTGSRLQDSRVAALCEDDPLRLLFQLVDHYLKCVCHDNQPLSKICFCSSARRCPRAVTPCQ